MYRVNTVALCVGILCRAVIADDPAASWIHGSFGDVVNLGGEFDGGLNSTQNDWFPAIAFDGLSLFFASDRAGTFGSNDIYEVRRESRAEPFAGANLRKVDELNTARNDVPGSLSPDGHILYFSTPSERGDWDIHMAFREDPDDPNGIFTDVVNLGPGVNSTASDGPPKICGDGNLLVFYSTEDGSRDLYQAKRLAGGGFGNRMKIGGGISTFMEERDPCISFDGLTLFFGEQGSEPLRPGGVGGGDIWVARRETKSDSFDEAVNLNAFSAGSSVNTAAQNAMPAISADWPAAGSVLYLVQYPLSGGFGGADLWMTEWTEVEEPLVFLRGDCNDDGAVDISDTVCILNWLFLGGTTPGCIAVTNTNGDVEEDISDAVYVLTYLFNGGPAPVSPFPECGPATLPTDEGACETPPENCL